MYCCIVKFTSFQRDGRRCYEYLFVCVKTNKMDSELLICLLKFIEFSQNTFRHCRVRFYAFFGQLLSKQLYIIGLLQLAVTWYMLEGKLPTGTSKTKRLHKDKFEFSLYWMSQYGVRQTQTADLQTCRPADL